MGNGRERWIKEVREIDDIGELEWEGIREKRRKKEREMK